MEAVDPSLGRRGQLVANSYRIGDVLGVGGMGVVYEAVQTSLDRKVALKLPRPELVDDASVRRQLHCEALAGSSLSHPNIVRVLDYGIDRDLPFVAMEHVVGPRLGQVLGEQGTLSVREALRIVRQVVSGLEEAHFHGVVHADIKCDNILIEKTRSGTTVPRLIDFGIARFVGDNTLGVNSEELDSVISGTPEYLAPEVISGRPPGFAADVYAVGVMLYELVTGVTPFAGGSSVDVMCRRLEDDVVPIARRCPDRDIPPEFDDVVLRALAREPGSRFADASSLAHALDTIVVDGTVPLPCSRSASATRVENTDAIIIDCLDAARALVDDHRLAAAIGELEAGITRVRSCTATAPVWRLQLTLAALYDCIGDRANARIVARNAREHALHCRSTTGCQRADRLLARLERRRAVTRRVIYR